jgi:Kef-type K+ transport system membrane component KefB
VSAAVSLLVGLLLLSYVGSILTSKRVGVTLRATSGAEYLVLGILLGPLLAGAIDRELLANFDAVSRIGAAWLALIAGLGFEKASIRAFGRATLGVVLTTLVASGVAVAAWFVAGMLWKLSWLDRALFSAGAGLLCSATAHFGFAAGSRQGSLSPGRFSEALREISYAGALVPALTLAVLLAFATHQGLAAFTPWARAGITLGTGVGLGALGALLLGREFRQSESWGLLLGLSFLGTGAAIRLGLSAVLVTFAMGLTIGVLSRHRADIRSMIAPTEKPVLLPVALLAGASMQVKLLPLLALVLGAVLLARVLLELVRGWLLLLFIKALRPGGAALGIALITPSTFTLAAGVELNDSLPSPLGPVLLLLAIASLIFGAIFGPLQLRRALQQAGEQLATEEPKAEAEASAEPQGALEDELPKLPRQPALPSDGERSSS